jgi:alkylation response protein AidB-like acyl-CoA dehydrogenase
MSYALSEEQCLIQQVAREFTQEYVAPLAVEIDKKDEHPHELVQKMAEHDFLGLFIPAEFGGAESDFFSFLLTVEELSQASGAVGSILINHSALALYAINRWGTLVQKQKFCTLMCKGKILGAFAHAESGAAPGVGPKKLIAKKDGEYYILNGQKSYVANGSQAGVYVVVAQSNPDAGAKGMSIFLVEKTIPGLSVGRKITRMGLRGCQFNELTFENVKIPIESLLGTENEGLEMVKDILAVASVAQGAQAVGIAQAALKDAVEYSKQRVQFGRPIAKFPAIQTLLVDIATKVHLVRLAVHHAAQQIDCGESFIVEAAMIKYFVNQIGQDALIDALQVEGGYGYSEDMLISRLFRDIRGTTLIDNSAEFPVKTIVENLLE